MARPFKSGLDYFPLDVHDDDKMKFIRIKFKITGVAIVFELYRKIYANSFFTKWNEDEALMFSDSIKAEYGEVLSVVNECLSRGIFDNRVFDGFGVLTSKGIQDRFAEATWRRKNCKYDFNYFVNDSRLDASRGEYVDTNLVNVDINHTSSVINDSQSTQSKVKESKVNRKESKIKEESKEALSENKVFKPLKKSIEERKEDFKANLSTYLDKYGKDMLNKFFLHFAEHNDGGSKMLFEKQRTWNLKMRLEKWSSTERPNVNFGKSGSFTESQNPANRIDPKRLEGCLN